MTTAAAEEYKLVLSVGDTTFLDYRIFDREGDIAEVFDQVRQLKHTGVVVRAAHNRSLDQNSSHLWAKMKSLPIRFEQEIDLPATANRKARTTKLAVR